MYRKRHTGFTLVEMLVAISVLLLIMILLVSITSQAGKVWSRGESQNQYRQRARAALDYIGQELRVATLPLDRDKIDYQFQINPAGLAVEYSCRDSIFWQAPIATSSVQGGLAEIGYFVQWDLATHQANLCRYFVNPDNSNYAIYNNPTSWVTDALMNAVAPATKASGYQGLFLENIIGIWVNATNVDGTSYDGNPQLTKKLPAYVEISIVGIDSKSANRMVAANQYSTVQGMYDKTDAAAFVAALPASVKNAATTVRLKVSLDNFK